MRTYRLIRAFEPGMTVELPDGELGTVRIVRPTWVQVETEHGSFLPFALVPGTVHAPATFLKVLA